MEENLKRIEEERNSAKSPSSSSTSSSSSANIKQSKFSPPEYKAACEFRTSQQQQQPHGGGMRKVDDVMRTIADWKSKTQLNDDNQENNLRSGGAPFSNSNLNRMTSGSNGGLFQSTQNTNNLRLFGDEPDNMLKAERYRDIVKDLKKKYTRSRTEVITQQLSYLAKDMEELFYPNLLFDSICENCYEKI